MFKSVLSQLVIMKKSIFFVAFVCVMSFELWGKEYQVANDTVKQDLRPDSTIICLLDGKQIPYKEAVKKATAGEIVWVTGANVPRDAIRYFGSAGKKGLYVFATKSKEEE